MSEFSPRMGWPYPSRDDDPWYDPFVDFIQASDGSAFAAREDRSVIWSGGGTLSWTAASGTLTWTDTISVYSPLGGRLLQVAAGSVAGWIEGEVLYLPLVRQPAATTSVSLVKASHVPSDDNAMALAVRVGMSIFFRTGISLGNGDSVVGVAPIAGGAATDPNAIHENVAGEISGIAPKGSPTGADRLLIEDAADGDNKKSVLISNLPAMTPATHNIGGSAHSSSTLLQFNAKISDATLDDWSAPRTRTTTRTSTLRRGLTVYSRNLVVGLRISCGPMGHGPLLQVARRYRTRPLWMSTRRRLRRGWRARPVARTTSMT
jgi:hypothetical protein